MGEELNQVLGNLSLILCNTVNWEIFGVKIFWKTPKIRKFKTQKIFDGTSLLQKERTQSGYPSLQMFNNNSSFHDGN